MVYTQMVLNGNYVAFGVHWDHWNKSWYGHFQKKTFYHFFKLMYVVSMLFFSFSCFSSISNIMVIYVLELLFLTQNHSENLGKTFVITKNNITKMAKSDIHRFLQYHFILHWLRIYCYTTHPITQTYNTDMDMMIGIDITVYNWQLSDYMTGILWSS